MGKKPETVLLRKAGSKHVEPFEPEHAKRLLAYPNTLWEEVAEKDAKDAKATSDATGHPTEV